MIIICVLFTGIVSEFAMIYLLWSFVFFWYVFFFKQKTAYEMRISDWSSDVCSSDLGQRHLLSPAEDPGDGGDPALRRPAFHLQGASGRSASLLSLCLPGGAAAGQHPVLPGGRRARRARRRDGQPAGAGGGDRKSTRLTSSH